MALKLLSERGDIADTYRVPIKLHGNVSAGDLDRIMRQYPGGQVTEKYDDHWKTYNFRAYYLPKDLYYEYLAKESVSLPPITPVPNP